MHTHHTDACVDIYAHTYIFCTHRHMHHTHIPTHHTHSSVLRGRIVGNKQAVRSRSSNTDPHVETNLKRDSIEELKALTAEDQFYCII